MYVWYLRFFVGFTVFTILMSFDWMHPLYIVVFLSMVRIFNVLAQNDLLEDKI